ncbi:hypothetical protein [Enemella sp. A6]|uniref:hypothetical protein n=1 Tax=Enemella sp. A6 TaxID=3440152 RepID=UPI003EBAD466
MTPNTDPLDLLAGLLMDDGKAWGHVATEWQRADAAAILTTDPAAPRLHFLTRPRGGSKTTDLAGIGLVVLLSQAPANSVSHAYARDRDQAGLLLDALRGLANRSGLAPLLDIGAWSVTVRSTGARLMIEPADAASAHGHLPYLVIVDELAQWPGTRGSQSLWQGIVSGLPKRSDSRLVCLTTAGDPAHFAHKIAATARTSDRWRVSEVPGPLPWADPDDLAEQRRLLPASVYARLHLNRWTAGEDRLVAPDDLAACVTLDGPLSPDPSRDYVIGLDLGLKGDRTVLTVCHLDRADPTAPVVVLDRIHVMAGTRAAPVQLADVERVAMQAATDYRAPIRLDPWQAVGLAQRLRVRGVTVQEWNFTPGSVGRLAMNLHMLLREHRMALPDDADLLDELANVRLRETTPGVFRLDHDSGHHDDRAVSLGLAALALIERATGGARITNPGRSGRKVAQTIRDDRARLPIRQRLRQAQRSGPRGLSAILIPGSANDPSTMRRE